MHSTPKARKAHWCEVCSWKIEPGDTYDRVITFDYGDVLTWKSHVTPCSKAASLARDAGYEDYADGTITGEAIAEWASESVRTGERIPEASEIQRRLEINTEQQRARALERRSTACNESMQNQSEGALHE